MKVSQKTYSVILDTVLMIDGMAANMEAIWQQHMQTAAPTKEEFAKISDSHYLHMLVLENQSPALKTILEECMPIYDEEESK